MRAARCARLSRNRQGLSTNTHVQLAECAQYVEDKGWTLGVTHADDDLSASRDSTKPGPGYVVLLADIAAGRVDVIVVTEMTRLYRRLEELLKLTNWPKPPLASASKPPMAGATTFPPARVFTRCRTAQPVSGPDAPRHIARHRPRHPRRAIDQATGAGACQRSWHQLCDRRLRHVARTRQR
jgi:hypothetical protein